MKTLYISDMDGTLYVGKNPAVKRDPATFSNPEEYLIEELADGSIALVAAEGKENSGDSPEADDGPHDLGTEF
mgnify:CR=1 FL=1